MPPMSASPPTMTAGFAYHGELLEVAVVLKTAIRVVVATSPSGGGCGLNGGVSYDLVATAVSMGRL